MDLKFLGTGGAFNTKQGNNCAFLKENENLLLIDCGEDVFAKLIKLKVLNNIQNVYIIISHLHGDHVGSLSTLIYYLNYIKNIKPKIVENNSNYQKTLSEFLKFSGVDESLYCTVNSNNVSCFSSIKKITPMPTKHSSKLQSFSYVFETDKGIIYYSSDTSDVEFLQKFIRESQNKIYKIYHDVCLCNSASSNHTALKMLNDIVPEKLKNKVYCMHFDCKKCEIEAQKMGFQVAKI